MSKNIREQISNFNCICKETEDIYHNIAEKMGLSDSALILLYGLCYAGRPCTQKELYETWSLRKQTAHSSLNKLLKDGYINMEPSKENSRVKIVSLTEKGDELVRKTAIPLLKVEEDALGRFTEEEREMFLRLSQKHLDFFKEETEKLLEWYENQKSSLE